MGSSQSKDQAQQQMAAPMISTDSPARAANTDSNNDDGSRNEERRRREGSKTNNDKSSQLTGFDLIQYQCRKKKRRYDQCYKKWYGSTFTAGQLDKDARDDCDDLFEAYQQCILIGMKKDRDRRGVGKANEDSAIGTFEAELEYENDGE
mmetsp:Transcript_17428/g.49888  ORF Transcript_17428/g.49888 Transcript_17428/m.49888 type:complete len:149 (-) Transcript_17428:75-521(-)|eukprot:CAMPEP_0181052824 /NCGR_PEP_ID=MMETSP1070-20121207/17791_1 /TAXON_ID=265543 /ORGANISM="Minutocellus polymorphus, Strain NH13" /LENGTH=148 /DNA_ID=CAMNT_0023131933 /DNA_START=36 /DNA_END=482 /DNA_ORIENTATION=+